MSQYSSRVPLEQVNNQNRDRDSYYSQNSKVTTTVRQCVSTTQNMTTSYMKRSMSGTNIYSSQINCPPTQRQQLGKNMDVVCFLMACEIDRFIAENDKLKYRIKEMDDKLLDRNSYEKQIEDLQARLFQLQYQEGMFRQEIEVTTTTLTQELESWKTRYYMSEEKFRQESDQMKSQLLQGDQKRQKEVEDLKSQCIGLRSQYENELQKARDQLAQRNQAMEYYQGEIKQLEQQLKSYRLVDEKNRDYENKIGMLVTETERLNGLLKCKLEELEAQKKQNQSYGYEIDKVKQDYRTLQSAFEKKQKDYDLLNQQFILIQNELIKYRDQDQIIEQLQNKTVMLTSEIERLNQVLREKINQGEEWRSKYFTSENQCNEMKQRLQKLDQLQHQLKDQLDKLNMMANSLEEQKQKNFQLQQGNQQLESNNIELQNRIGLLGTEIERLNSILKGRIHELEEWKQKYAYLEGEMKNKNAQYNDCKTKLGALSQEIDRLQDILKHKQQELNESINAMKQYQKELQNSEQMQQQLLRTIEEWKRKFEMEQSDGQLKQKRVQEYENRIALLSSEIERLNQVLQVKLQELDEQKRQQFGENQRLKQSNSTLQQQLQMKVQELEEWMSKYKRLEQSLMGYQQLDDKLKQAQFRIILHCAEIDRLTLIQAEVFDENEQLQNQIQHYQNSNKQKDDQLYKALDRNNLLQKLCDEEKQKRQQLEMQIKETYENKLALITTENQRLNEQLRIKNGEIEDYRTSIQRYENKLMILNQEVERLNSQLKKMQFENDTNHKEFESLQSQYQLILRQNEELRLRITQLESYKNKYLELENRCAMLSTEIERLQALIQQRNDEIEQLRRKIHSLEQTIVQLKQYEENVRILSQEIDRLQSIIDQQDAELRTWRLQYADGGAVNRKLQDLMFHFVMMSAEIESLRARVQEKEKEVEEVRRSSLAPYRR